ncbi:MAG: bifunctional (p)ppGpp synthetase/guanosine-3',5'-bis(diphosphate) 3'-pyrophosphohydrolase [Verrucomicrobia bacterium]|nr:bifunctional (p)ppGpp synthetase/guanosine-3',5'-bis(diphosphate) 3'-pyrophosphohydrolase [Verrucomicrobiota bacterium]
MQSLLRAASFAARKHRGQTRADGATPYFSHVARVTLILSHVFGVNDADTLTAAFLHDTIEDTATDYDELEEVFGRTVADYVVALTKNVMLPKKKREAEYEERLVAAPENVKIAKMADIYDNLSDRVNSPKIVKTTATAERLLAAFGDRLETALGRKAHEKTLRLLATIEVAAAVKPRS